MKSPKCTRNEHIRKQISSIISTSTKDTIIKTDAISGTLSKHYSGVSHRNVGNLLRERDDVEWVTNGTWRVL